MFETTGTINFTNSYIFTNTSDNIKGISNANNYKFINDINKVINIESTGYMSYHNYNFPQIITLNNPKVRTASRGIVLRDDGKIALFYKSKMNEYKLPGGGIDEGEDKFVAFEREILEEVGKNYISYLFE